MDDTKEILELYRVILDAMDPGGYEWLAEKMAKAVIAAGYRKIDG